MNLPLNGFRIMVAIGVLVNAAFWGPALIATQIINDTFGFDSDYYTVWLRNVGLVLVLVSITNVAAAVDPVRYRLFAWLVVAGRLIAAALYRAQVARQGSEAKYGMILTRPRRTLVQCRDIH